MKPRRHNARKYIDTVGLALYYKLWAGLLGANKVFDYSQNGNDGTVVGTSIVPAYPGFALAGNDEYFNVGSPMQACFQGSFTIVFWVKVYEGRPGGQTIFIGEQDGTSFVNMAITGGGTPGRIVLRLQSAGNKGTDAITNDQFLVAGANPWIQVAGVMDSTIQGPGGKLLYINGVLQTLGASDGDTTGVVSANYASAQNLYIGAANANGAAGSWTGGVFDIPMIFDKVKTASELLSLYMSTRQFYKV